MRKKRSCAFKINENTTYCKVCGKSLRKDNTRGVCQAHQSFSNEIKEYKYNHHLKNKEKHNEKSRERYYKKRSALDLNRVCPICNKHFIIKSLNTIYCSKKCGDRAYKIKNREKINKNNKNMFHTDIQFRLIHNLRVRINKALRGAYKINKTIDSLGCSPEELKLHLESKFQPGMTWENWGINGWHVDHVKPLALFNLQNPEEFKKACHYTNLQPLWAKDNLKKSNKPYDIMER